MEITVNCADDYFSARLNSESWFELSETEKLSAIKTAEDKIYSLQFIGTQVTPQQESPFPRYYKYAVIDMPDDVVKAVFEEAYYEACDINGSQTQIPKGVSSLSLGSASISFKNSGNSFVDNLSTTAVNFLEKWLKKGFDSEEPEIREVY